VIPTLAAGGLALGTMGVQGAAAVLNSDMGTGIRMAAPLAMLSTLALCSQRGVLVKDGRALDLLCEIDTVLFDKTGTLTRERPEVGTIITTNGYQAADILRFAAAAEHRFHHPIARAILQRAVEEELDVPPIDTAQYKVGHGITVGVEGRTIRVGSRRFMEMEGIALTPEVRGGPPRRPQHGDGCGRRRTRRRPGIARLGPPRSARDHQGTACPRHPAHRDHLRRPRGADPKAGE
jgi:Cu2+-exporting ATPase